MTFVAAYRTRFDGIGSHELKEKHKRTARKNPENNTEQTLDAKRQRYYGRARETFGYGSPWRSARARATTADGRTERGEGRHVARFFSVGGGRFPRRDRRGGAPICDDGARRPSSAAARIDCPTDRPHPAQYVCRTGRRDMTQEWSGPSIQRGPGIQRGPY